ncbi:MAG: hypothetical protein N2038_14075 [Geminicoccaceae bacterium]|nr:hypothetical protein [Geminicoccaceae bacterium]
MIDECFDLRFPGVEVLDLVEENESGLSARRRCVQIAAEHPSFVPRHETQDGIVADPPQPFEFVELYPKNSARFDLMFTQERRDQLLQQRRLADLPRTAQDQDRRQGMEQSFAQLAERPTAKGRDGSGAAPLPPRILPTQFFDGKRGEMIGE